MDAGKACARKFRMLGVTVILSLGELDPHLTQCGRSETYLRAKFHLDPFNRLATVHQRHRQTDRTWTRQDRTGQRTDSIGRTVLQTVAQKLQLLPAISASRPVRDLSSPRVGVSASCPVTGYWTTRGYRLCGHTESSSYYACKNINKWLSNNIQLHFIMKHFNMTQ